jgi:SAM-dependent methyltransferase
MSTGIAGYYDRLGRWNRVARAIGYGGGSATLTVHRALADPMAGGRPTFTRLHDVIIERLRQLKAPRVLDAGCGLGGTMLVLADALDATCMGLTLSRSQADGANAAALAANRAVSVRALVQTYDDPPSGPFDVIVAIESLAHSADPERSLAALAAVLAPGGRFVVVDDMPEAAPAHSRDLAAFKTGWQCPMLLSADGYRDAFVRLGLHVEDDLDLTGEMRPRSRRTIAWLMAVNRLVARIPVPGLKLVMDSHRGGLALERLTRDGLVRYRLLIARRPEVQVS